jgi:hypothetical protein
MKTPDKELGTVARTLTAEKLRTWIKDSTTPIDRLRMYGFLLGNCGGEADTGLLRELLEKLVVDTEYDIRRRREPRGSNVFDGILTGYVLLKPKEGWSYVRQLMGNPADRFSFPARYSALRAARFFYNTRPDVIGKPDILDALHLPLSQPDIADLPVNDLRQWKCWDLTNRVLPLYRETSWFVYPNVCRAILYYALQCPQPEASAFLASVRKYNGKLVAEAEEQLKQESSP